MTDVVERLTLAQAARDSGDLRAALALLLDVWRESPSTSVADAIAAVSARATIGIEPPDDATWNAWADEADPVRVGVLCETLSAGSSAATLARIERLAARGSDPRLVAKLVAMIEMPAYSLTATSAHRFWQRLWSVLVEVADPSTAWRVDHVLPLRWQALDERDRATLERARLEALPALWTIASRGANALPAEAHSLCAALAAPIAITHDQLLAAIYAAPDEDAPRLVYADWLLERGDPRGELIALQLAVERTPAQLARERELLAAHAPAWIAPLPIDSETATFERGFVAGGHAYRPIDDDPAWATVRRLDALPSRDHDNLGSLRDVHGVTSTAIAGLAALSRPLAITELRWSGLCYYGGSFVPAIDVFAQLDVLPALERLVIEPAGGWTSVGAGALGWLFDARCARGLVELTLPLVPQFLAGVIEELERLCVQRFVVHGSWQIAVERDASDRLGRMTVSITDPDSIDELIDGLDRLPADQLSAATVQLPRKVNRVLVRRRDELDRALAVQNRLVRD